jgi:penicillin-binding protein 2
MAPRRNPDIVVVVLAEHGGWGAEAAAPLAAQVINAFVTKQRKHDGNLHVADIPNAPRPAAAPGAPAASTPAPPSPAAPIAMNHTSPGAAIARSSPPTQP